MFDSDKVKENIKKTNEAVKGKNRMVHGAFLYGCHKCRITKPIFLGYGVEGPEELREACTYIASPFMADSCEKCGETLQHVFFGSDQHFELRPMANGEKAFIIPDDGLEIVGSYSSCFMGEIVTCKL